MYYPFLHQLIGKTLIVTDGTTLLGADNKAGIAEIMTALSVLQQENIPHCNIQKWHLRLTKKKLVSIHYFPLDDFPCDWAYTMMVGKWVSSSMRILMRQWQKSPLKDGEFILVMRKTN